MQVTTISPRELNARREGGQNVEVIDVRTPVEFREVHADLARNVPLDVLDPAAVVKARTGPADQPLYVICRTGNRGQMACASSMRRGTPTSSTSKAAPWPGPRRAYR